MLTIVLPLLGLATAITLLWGVAFSWVYLVLLLVGYVLTGMGITIGFHRLFTHKSFATGPVITAILGILGSMAVEGPLIKWTANHRKHHNHSDRKDDPHSPHTHGAGLRGFFQGIYHSHMGWFFLDNDADFDRYVPDLLADRLVRRINYLFPLWVVLGLALPAVIAGLVTWSWTGALLGFLWGGLVRVFVVHHITWSINSACHLWGSRPFTSHDHSRNNLIFGVLAFGEGWHNNHHAFPASARHGLRWWQFDSSYLVIRALATLGLARSVRIPTPDRMAAKAAPRT
ncbi:MAG: fatty acid desaturase [Phycisphaerae bacterium]|nr:fatty acid desaturase [Phycisphaerae bacterium]